MSSNASYTSEQIEETVELVRVFDWTRKAAVTALCWLVYDYALTLETEVTHVWLRPWSWFKVMFGWTRYFGMITVMIWCLSSLLSPSQLSPSIGCELNYYFGAWGGIIIQVTLSVIMILRLWALYHGNRLLGFILAGLLLIHITALCVIFGLGTRLRHYAPPAPYLTLNLNECYGPHSPPSFTGIWASRLALDTVFFGCVLWKGIQQYTQGWHSDIVEMLITDNTAAFAFALFVQVVNLVILLAQDPQAAQAWVGIALSTDVTVGCRLLLHTKEVIDKRQNPYEIEFSVKRVSPPPLNVTPELGGLSFEAAVRDTYAASTGSSGRRSTRFSHIDTITLVPIEEEHGEEYITGARESAKVPARTVTS